MLLNPLVSFALEQHEQLWIAMNYEKPLTNDKKWYYLLYTQSRFINESHPWDSTLFEGALGYWVASDKSVWLGYRWTAQDPNNGFSQQNRLWQQLQWILTDNRYKIILRTRLEEIEQTNQSDISVRLRERLMIKFSHLNFHLITPMLYDELFFQLHKTNYSSQNFVSQNRLFVGVDIRRSPGGFWEVGYINQYIFNSNSQAQNVMNHIVSVTYNFA